MHAPSGNDYWGEHSGAGAIGNGGAGIMRGDPVFRAGQKLTLIVAISLRPLR